LVLLLICWHCYKVQEGLTDETPCECDSESDSDEEEDNDKYDADGNLISGPGFGTSQVIKEIVRKNMMVDAIRKMMNRGPQKYSPCSAATTCKQCGAADEGGGGGSVCYWCTKANGGKGGCFDTSIEPDNCPAYSRDCTSEDCKNYGSSGSGCPA